MAVGSYPRALEELVPWYLWSLPEPMTIYGLDWCYESDGDFYYLGYLTRQHWSSPELIIRSYHSASAPPDLQLDCSALITSLEARTGWQFTLVDE